MTSIDASVGFIEPFGVALLMCACIVKSCYSAISDPHGEGLLWEYFGDNWRHDDDTQLYNVFWDDAAYQISMG